MGNINPAVAEITEGLRFHKGGERRQRPLFTGLFIRAKHCGTASWEGPSQAPKGNEVTSSLEAEGPGHSCVAQAQGTAVSPSGVPRRHGRSVSQERLLSGRGWQAGCVCRWGRRQLRTGELALLFWSLGRSVGASPSAAGAAEGQAVGSEPVLKVREPGGVIPPGTR